MDDIYRTTHLPLAVYLTLSGVKLTGLTRLSDQQAVFLFKNEPLILELSQEFSDNKAKVNPVAFLAELRRLKRLAENICREGAYE